MTHNDKTRRVELLEECRNTGLIKGCAKMRKADLQQNLTDLKNGKLHKSLVRSPKSPGRPIGSTKKPKPSAEMYDSWSVTDLKAECKRRKLEGCSTKRRDELIQVLKNYDKGEHVEVKKTVKVRKPRTKKVAGLVTAKAASPMKKTRKPQAKKTASPKAASPKAASPKAVTVTRKRTKKAVSPKAVSPKAASPKAVTVTRKRTKKAVSPKAASPKAVSPKAVTVTRKRTKKAVSPKAASPKAVSPKAASPTKKTRKPRAKKVVTPVMSKAASPVMSKSASPKSTKSRKRATKKKSA
jgi:hypothetical protein